MTKVPSFYLIFILNNILLMHESIQWVFESKTRRSSFSMVHFVMNDSQHLLGMLNYKSPHAMVNIMSIFLLHLVLL